LAMAAMRAMSVVPPQVPVDDRGTEREVRLRRGPVHPAPADRDPVRSWPAHLRRIHLVLPQQLDTFAEEIVEPAASRVLASAAPRHAIADRHTHPTHLSFPFPRGEPTLQTYVRGRQHACYQESWHSK
jgi:hypothetical protein